MFSCCKSSMKVKPRQAFWPSLYEMPPSMYEMHPGRQFGKKKCELEFVFEKVNRAPPKFLEAPC